MQVRVRIFTLLFLAASAGFYQTQAYAVSDLVGDVQCNTEKDCPPLSCCSKFGYCGRGPEWCDTTPTPYPTPTSTKGKDSKL